MKKTVSFFINAYSLLPLAFCFLSFAYCITASCRKSDDRPCFKSHGKIIEETRSAGIFDSISLQDNVNLILKQDTFYSIRVETSENLIRFIKTEISENCLFVKNENKCDFLRSYKYPLNVYVSFVDLNSIYFTGTGKITSENTLKVPLLDLNLWNASGTVELALDAGTVNSKIHTGPGDIILKGKAGISSLYSNGNGFMYHNDLICSLAWVTNRGTGDFFVQVQNELSVEIGSEGSVYYTGNPSQIMIKRKGKGELVKM